MIGHLSNSTKFYYTTIKFETICKNDNWKLGGNAFTVFSDDKEFSFKVETHMYGKTKKEAEAKLLKFLRGSEQHEIECIGELCQECKSRPAVVDYNGCGHWVCKRCDDKLEKEFEEDYD